VVAAPSPERSCVRSEDLNGPDRVLAHDGWRRNIAISLDSDGIKAKPLEVRPIDLISPRTPNSLPPPEFSAYT
jgi:hypothetical protein